MSAQGTDSGTAWAESIPALACKADSLAATSRSNHPSLEFVGRMKTFHTCIDIPGCTAMDYHLVCAQPEVISNFHRLHNQDELARVGPWSPASFDDAPDCTKRRTILYTSQLNIPTWLQKILGRSCVEVRNEQETTLNRANGNLTISSRPLIMASGGSEPRSEYELASVFYQVLNRRAADGSTYITVDVTVTAKADQPWLWGVKSAVEAVFITQAKDDILSFLEYNLRLFKELHRTLQLPSQQRLRTSRSHATPRGSPDGLKAAHPAQGPRMAKPGTPAVDMTAGMQQTRDAAPPPRQAMQEQGEAPQRPHARPAAEKRSAVHFAPQVHSKEISKSQKAHASEKGSPPGTVYYDALEEPSQANPRMHTPGPLTAVQESDEERVTPPGPERPRQKPPAQHPTEMQQHHSMHTRAGSAIKDWETDDGLNAQRSPNTRHAGADPLQRAAYTPRYAKPEPGARRAPQTARPAGGIAPSRVLYERPSTPYAVEWEQAPDITTKGGRNDLEGHLDPAEGNAPAPQLQDALWDAVEQPPQHDMALQPLPQSSRPWAPLQDVHAPKEQGRYYIIMPAGGVSGGRQEGPRVLEEVYITEEDASGGRCVRLREVNPHTAQAYLAKQPPQRRLAIPDDHLTPARHAAGGTEVMPPDQTEVPAGRAYGRTAGPEAPHTPFQGSPTRQHGIPSSPEEELRAPAQQPHQRDGGRGRLRGSQTARGDPSPALSGSRREMTETKRSAEDALRRVSADMIQSEAERYFQDEGQSAVNKKKQKKRNWFLELFRIDNNGKSKK